MTRNSASAGDWRHEKDSRPRLRLSWKAIGWLKRPMNWMFPATAKPRSLRAPIGHSEAVVRRTGSVLPRFTVLAGLAVLAVSLTFRLLWLDRLPGINGDEAWYGVQVQRCLEGMTWSGRTPTGLPINPLLFLTEWLLLQICEPSFWVLRLPIAMWSAAGLGLTYVFYRWVYGERSESLFLVCLTACLPGHLAHSRFCWDGSFAFVSFPLFIFPLLRVLHGRRGWVDIALLFTGSLLTVWVHATHALLVVAGLAVLAWEFRATFWTCIHRRPITSAAFVVTGAFIAGWVVDQSRHTRILLGSITTCVERLPQHLVGLADVLVGPRVFSYLSGAPVPDWITWVYVAFYLVLAWLLSCMFRRGSSGDRKLGTVAVGVLVLVLLTGRMLRLHRESYERYILYLVPFSALIIMRGLSAMRWRSSPAHAPRSARCGDRVDEDDGSGCFSRSSRVLAPLGISCVCLVQFWCGYLQPLRQQTYATRLHRTFQSDVAEPKAAAAEMIRQRSPSRPEPLPVFVEDWWVEHALEYLLDSRWSVSGGVPPSEIAGPAFVVGFTGSRYVEEVIAIAQDRQSLIELIHVGHNGYSPILSVLELGVGSSSSPSPLRAIDEAIGFP
jgi:hypothetical protein